MIPAPGKGPHPYYIYCPDYRDDSAGVRVLHRLCDALNRRGFEAYVTAQVTSPELRTPRLTDAIELAHKAEGRVPVTVYPEVTSGNPRRAPVVVRYLLNRPGLLAGDTTFPDSEMLFAYLPEIVPAGMQARTLCIPVCNTGLFHPPAPDAPARQGHCVFAHRYLKQGGALDRVPAGALEISYRHPRSLAELADIFRRTEVLYSYEISILCWEAMLCGCPVVYLPNDYMSSHPYKDVFGCNGSAWGDRPDDVAHAKATIGRATEIYHELEHSFLTHLEVFIEVTQSGARRYVDEHQLKLQLPSGQISTTLVPMAPATLWASPRLPDYQVWLSGQAWDGDRYVRARAAALSKRLCRVHLAMVLGLGQEAGLARTLASLIHQFVGEWHLTVIAPFPLLPGHPVHPCVDWRVSDAGLTAVNEALIGSVYDWVGRLEAGDLLEDRALYEFDSAIGRHPDWRLVYCDEDAVDVRGQLAAPFFKPDYSPEMMRVTPQAMGGLMLIEQGVFASLGGFAPEAKGAEHYDLALRVFERVGTAGMGHVADVLCHRRVEADPARPDEATATQAAGIALSGHLARMGIDAQPEEGLQPGTFRLRHACAGTPLVSIVVATRNGGERLQRCVGAVVENTDYKHWQLIVMDLSSDAPDTLAFLDQLRQVGEPQARVVSMPLGHSLPELFNQGARLAAGEYLLFMSDGCAPLRGDWLEEMLGYALLPDVGVVGARLIASDLTLSHAGYLLGYQGKPAASHSLHTHMDEPGYFGRLHLPHNPSAVSMACMMVSRSLFGEVGGFDTGPLAQAYGDVAFCLECRERGKRMVWTPHAVLLHEHSTPAKLAPAGNNPKAEPRIRHRASPAAEVMFGRWLTLTAHDPAYNRNLSLSRTAFEIETLAPLVRDPEQRFAPRVLAHPADRTGCGEYRVLAPMRRLNAAGRIEGFDTEQYYSIPELARLSPDTILFQRQVDWEQIAEMEAYLRFSRAFRIYELDDLLTNIQKKNSARGAYEAKDFIERFQKALSLCNRLVVSTEYLAEEYGRYAEDVKVVPNYLEAARWGHLSGRRATSAKPRVGWAGSVTHGGDLEIIIDVVKATRKDIDWVFLGMCPKDVQKLVKEFHPGVPLAAYPAKLASLNLDLAVAPLEDVPFNHGKSHLKILEYGILGYPVIATDITPYRGAFPITRVPNRFKDWVEAIREHVSDRDELARRGDALREHIRANWMLDDHLEVWLKAWLPS